MFNFIFPLDPARFNSPNRQGDGGSIFDSDEESIPGDEVGIEGHV